MMNIKAAVALKPNEPLEILDLQLDDPKKDEVLIKVVSTGICHTDVVCSTGWVVPLPLVLGHECTGIVEKLALM